ncbi:MAG: hypothetical protein A2Z91_08700 [Deltaproteobacteria bacterium GWA2_38_16]|nr:MAG: hypothetical protein A2Z91_08700 [Deltaproteobacteria bacterium GWA2_38_16]OGQ03873.1 MAG: hypothetical protein A3D19_07265 [Deltaproteobacteria bacterium RIFCSPHIGHO2_02_FULL_38_15]OGQ33339.1 MAG: hypothetical protein A3A72_08550 [Deltaproteobacteria bacterium RIFCSPLOWO2_01_FULL_38_9]HBQ20919.1 hypothetical protein [Deltaproteobacteria bacterium]
MALTKLLKADFHMHTKDDPQDKKFVRHSAEALIDHAAKLGFEVLSITNHNKITYSPYLREYAAVRGILLLPGVEVTVEKKHILLINYLGPLGFKKIEDLKNIHTPQVLIIAAHPFFPASTTLKQKLIDHIDVFDAVEYCHFYLNWINFNRKAVRISKQYEKPLVGTSDAHTLAQMNHTYTMVEAGKTSSAVVEAIKKGKIKLVTHALPLRVMYSVFHMFGTSIFR